MPENRITGAGGYTYTYDADGNRVEKSNSSTGTIYWYMSPGIVGESDLSGNLQSEYVFFDGERVARKDLPSNAVSYYFSDHLKTASVITDSAGNIKEDEDLYPWGGELQFVNSDSNHYKFTGKERDAETGLDYMLARYYSNPLGRFLTPDWAGKPITVPYANLGNPQSLNLYSYVKNNPTAFGDPDGHCDGPMSCTIAFGAWLGGRIAEQGSVKAVAKDSGIGLLKGTGNFAVNTVKTGVALSQAITLDPVGAAKTMMKPNPKILQPSNQTQADVSKGTQVALTVASVVVPLASAAAPAAGAAALDGASTAPFFHYGYLADEANFANGLRAGSFATTEGGLTGAEAQSGLALPHATVPDAVYPVTPEPGTLVTSPTPAAPQFGQPGGLPEVQFPRGTGPGTVGPPTPIPPN